MNNNLFNDDDYILNNEFENISHSNALAVKKPRISREIVEVSEQEYFQDATPKIKNPYASFYQTLKNPFELNEDVQEIYQEEIAQHRQLVLKEHSKLSKLPKFYYVERNIYGLKALSWAILLLASIITAILFVFFYFTKNGDIDVFKNLNLVWFNGAYFSIPAIVGLASAIAMTFQLIYFSTLWKYIINQKNNFDSSTISGVTQNIYKRLLVSFININWGCFIYYLLAAFYILIMFIVSYFISMSYDGVYNGLHFGQMTMGPANDLNYKFRDFPKLSCIIIGTLTLFVIIFQVVSQMINWSRINKMDLEFNVPILTMEEKVAIKKVTHKKNFICFLVIFLLLGILALIIYFIMRGRKK